MVKPSQFKTAWKKNDSGYLTQLKKQKQKGDITYQHTTISQCSDK